ncbi:O-antigen ligase family protein [Erythrobacter tepidarius]|uniref:O-antigen ligase family protein n=1 Tax=Erythrobacter tepidarius TaxID=60454 RepID=UPI000A3B085C|nr:O-antigen ligase family protein [Erythrobacter tepidarius]
MPLPARQAARGALSANVLLAVVLGYIMLLPPQFNIPIGTSVIPPYRFVLLASVFYIVGSRLRGQWRFVLPDALMLVAAVWIWVAFFVVSATFEDFFTASVAQTCDIIIPYFFARSTLRSLRDLRLFLILMAPAFAVTAAIITLESVTKTHIIQPLARSLLGVGGGYSLIDYRLGLLRAAGPFPHPILAGVVLSTLLSLYWFSGLRGWPRLVGVGAALASFFTVSSAALLALTSMIVLIIYDWLTERIANISWRLFFILFGIFVFVAELGTKSGTYSLLVRFGSLNSSSAYYRTLIWRFGKQNVEKHPWFGIGYAEWERPFWMGKSVDHYWLLQAIQVGIVPPLMYAIVIFLAFLALIRRQSSANLVDGRALRGVAIAMVVMAFAVVSVAVWLSAQVWFHLMMGLSVSMGYATYAVLRAPAPRGKYPVPVNLGNRAHAHALR